MLSKIYEFCKNGKLIYSTPAFSVDRAKKILIDSNNMDDKIIKTLNSCDVSCKVYDTSTLNTSEHIQGFCIAKKNDDSQIRFWAFKGGFTDDFHDCMVYQNVKHASMVIDNIKDNNKGDLFIMEIDGNNVPHLMIKGFANHTIGKI